MAYLEKEAVKRNGRCLRRQSFINVKEVCCMKKDGGARIIWKDMRRLKVDEKKKKSDEVKKKFGFTS